MRRALVLLAVAAVVAAGLWFVLQLATSYFHLFSIFGVKP